MSYRFTTASPEPRAWSYSEVGRILRAFCLIWVRVKLRKGGERFLVKDREKRFVRLASLAAKIPRPRPDPLVQASAPRPVRDPYRISATLGKPLNRKFLFYPFQHLSMLTGSGLCAAREPRLPRVPKTRAPKRFAVKNFSARRKIK